MNYRVDVFRDNEHEWAFFETMEKALHFAKLIRNDEMTIYFLEKGSCETLYTIVKML